MSDETSVTQDVLLTLHCRTADGWLYVNYEITNRSAAPLLSYDGAPGDREQEWPDLTGQVYVSWQGPDAVLVKRVRAPIPAGKRITQVRIPAVYQLQSGQSRQVRFRLRLPLMEHSEYFPQFSGATYEIRRVNRIQLWIGYFFPRSGTKLEPLGENTGIYRAHGEFGVQQFVMATAFAGVEVKVRTDSQFQRV